MIRAWTPVCGSARSACRVAVLSLALGPGSAGPAAGLEVPLLFVQEPVGGGGSRIAGLGPDGELRVLTAEFAAAADPAVSFDGQRVLFAGRRRAGEGWEIWRMAPDGSGKEQVTHGLADAREPVWLPPAAVNPPVFDEPVDWIAFTSTRASVSDELGRGALANLYAMSLSPVPGHGTVVWRTTYGLGGDRTPTVLVDGRVLFASWQREGYALMTISWSGENLNPFFGSHDGEVSQVWPCELPEARTVVFVEAEATRPQAGGRLAAVSMRRPLHSHRVLAADGLYRTPAGLPDGGLAVAWRGRSAPSYGIFRVDPETGRRGEVLYDDPEWHDLDPTPVAPRSVPTGRIPMVEFASVLDVHGFERAGQLQCLNVYESDRPGLENVRHGAVNRVRLVAGVPVPLDSLGGWRAAVGEPVRGAWPPPFVRTRSLGEAPVEADGSFYVNVAGNLPFYIQTLDGSGGVVGTMRTWMWVRAGDQRGCVGCHEDRELAPENRVTEALRRARPVSLMGQAEPAGQAAP